MILTRLYVKEHRLRGLRNWRVIGQGEAERTVFY